MLGTHTHPGTAVKLLRFISSVQIRQKKHESHCSRCSPRTLPTSIFVSGRRKGLTNSTAIDWRMLHTRKLSLVTRAQHPILVTTYMCFNSASAQLRTRHGPSQVHDSTDSRCRLRQQCPPHPSCSRWSAASTAAWRALQLKGREFPSQNRPTSQTLTPRTTTVASAPATHLKKDSMFTRAPSGDHSAAAHTSSTSIEQNIRRTKQGLNFLLYSYVGGMTNDFVGLILRESRHTSTVPPTQ